MFMKSRLLSALASLFTLISTTTSAAVLPLEWRLGGTAVYDPNLDISWLVQSGIGPDTPSFWIEVAQSLTNGGVDWRLPSADVDGDGVVVDCFGGGVTGCDDNEMGHLYWEQGITAATPGPFKDLSSVASYAYDSRELGVEWYFNFFSGTQGIAVPNAFEYFALFVSDGDVGFVPVPPAAWLFGSGLLGLIGIARR
jgi:hypothetical protein